MVLGSELVDKATNRNESKLLQKKDRRCRWSPMSPDEAKNTAKDTRGTTVIGNRLKLAVATLALMAAFLGLSRPWIQTYTLDLTGTGCLNLIPTESSGRAEDGQPTWRYSAQDNLPPEWLGHRIDGTLITWNGGARFTSDGTTISYGNNTKTSCVQRETKWHQLRQADTAPTETGRHHTTQPGRDCRHSRNWRRARRPSTTSNTQQQVPTTNLSVPHYQSRNHFFQR